MHILIAMQNTIYAEYIAKHLLHRNHQVTVCADGKEALEALGNQAWQLVILGITLDYYNGFEVIDRFNKMDEAASYSPHIMIISMTKNPKTVKIAEQLGVCNYLQLPVDTKFLLQKITEIE